MDGAEFSSLDSLSVAYQQDSAARVRIRRHFRYALLYFPLIGIAQRV